MGKELENGKKVVIGKYHNLWNVLVCFFSSYFSQSTIKEFSITKWRWKIYQLALVKNI